MTLYQYNLIEKVLENSESDNWLDAVKEWKIIKCETDFDCSGICICGKERIKYLFTIQNSINDRLLEPIGSTCIKKFERSDLVEETQLIEAIFKLYDAFKKNQYIALDKGLFTRKLLKWLYNQGAFIPKGYDSYDDKRDYEFMLKMFNKRNKNEITQPQQRKINFIIINSIKPYLAKTLNVTNKFGRETITYDKKRLSEIRKINCVVW